VLKDLTHAAIRVLRVDRETSGKALLVREVTQLSAKTCVGG
jgi:hypothetical protein